jgi:hypothetical protein
LVVDTDIGSMIRDYSVKAGIDSISVETSAAGVMKVLKELKPEDNGSFFSYDGTALPW